MRRLPVLFVLLLPTAAAAGADDGTSAARQKPMTAAEARDFMKRLARFVEDNHLKKAPASEQRGMVYEYFDPRRRGQYDQFVQGEALDTMHDGAWLAAALASAYRAGGDPYYKDWLTQWSLPFYCKMLNHGDELFSNKHNHARPDRQGLWRENKEWLLQDGEKGFVPYWWDDGGSVSLEMLRARDPRPSFPCLDRFTQRQQANPRFVLDGYSLGSSNHMAQDLGVMLQLAWLLLKDSADGADRRLRDEVAEAAENLRQCRMRHHGHIPMCDAPAALARGDAGLLGHVPDRSTDATWAPDNHYTRALYDARPGQRYALPGFADDQEYNYYAGIARHGGRLPRALAFKVIYDAYTERLLYRYYSDDAEVPAGVNRFDLHPYYVLDGKLTDYRSDRKGPGGRPRPAGSRMGPQTMVCCGWALQALRAYPGVWEERHRQQFGKDLLVPLVDPPRTAEDRRGPPAVAQDTVGGVPLRLHGTRDAFHVAGTAAGDEVVLKVFGRPDGQGRHAVLTLRKDGAVGAVNDRGEKLLATADVKAGGEGFEFRVALPYTVVKAQNAWANGVEQQRYSVQVGGATRNLYLASPEGQVKAWLEHELAGGLRTWEAIFRDRGYIPTGLDAGADWDRFSDSGGYAHLIAAAAQWLLYLDGKNDWEVHRVPALAVK